MDKKFLELIGEVLVESVKASLVGIGLKDSEIINDVSYKIENDSVSLIMPSYYVYIESGRRPLTKKVPINILINWMKRKGIGLSNLNNIAFAIQNSIYKKGIKPRPFLNTAQSIFDKQSEKIFTIGFDELTKDLDKLFK